MSKARIYRPDKTAMQSGKAGMKEWRLEFVPEKPLFIDPLMGWTGMTDMPREIKMFFPTREAAEAYCKRQGIPYEAVKPQPRRQIRKAYADNFKFGRVQ